MKTFKSFLKESNHKPNKTGVDKGNDFYSRSMKSWLQVNYIDIYTKINEGKLVVVEIFIRTSKNKICKCMTAVSKTYAYQQTPSNKFPSGKMQQYYSQNKAS